MVLIHTKRPSFDTKPNKAYMGLWLHAGIQYFDVTLHCSYSAAAVFPPMYYITSDTQHNFNYLYPFATFPFRLKSQSVFNHSQYSFFLFRFFHLYWPIMKPAATEETASKATTEAGHALPILFVESAKVMDFRLHFDIGGLHVNQVLKQFMFSNAVIAKQIPNVLRAEASVGSKLLKLTIFASFRDPNLQKYRHETCLACTASIPCYGNVNKEKRSRARSLFNPLQRRSEFCDTNQWESVSAADRSQHYTTRLHCYIEHRSPISSPGLNVCL